MWPQLKSCLLQVLYTFPAGKAPELGHVGLYCFPHGVQPREVQRTPSLTALNQFFCGQQYSNAETSSFVFYAKVRPCAAALFHLQVTAQARAASLRHYSGACCAAGSKPAGDSRQGRF